MYHKWLISEKQNLRHGNSNENLTVLLPWWRGCFKIYECNSIDEVLKALEEPIIKPVIHKCIITNFTMRTNYDGFVIDKRIMKRFNSNYTAHNVKIARSDTEMLH